MWRSRGPRAWQNHTGPCTAACLVQAQPLACAAQAPDFLPSRAPAQRSHSARPRGSPRRKHVFRKPREPMGRGKDPLSITAGKPPGLRTGGGAGTPAEYSLLSGLWSRQLLCRVSLNPPNHPMQRVLLPPQCTDEKMRLGELP